MLSNATLAYTEWSEVTDPLPFTAHIFETPTFC